MYKSTHNRYKVIHASDCVEQGLPGYEDKEEWEKALRWSSFWVLWECDDSGNPVREVFNDRMEPEDAILVRDLSPLVDELNRVYDAWQDQKAM